MQVESPWYVDWQNQKHASVFDGRHALTERQLVKNYEAFNDVRMLNEYVVRQPLSELLEVGCATGEFHRYLRIRHPDCTYTGMDISQPAVQRAQEKYPKARFALLPAEVPLKEGLREAGLADSFPAVYSKDVLHHQVQPWSFLAQLLEAARDLLILRTRTRDRGTTVLDPALSCQYHYNGWMPFIVFNLNELTEAIRRQVPGAEILIYRNPMILGGRENRFLPKECYLPETGTAETAVGIFLKTSGPGKVTLQDREDMNPRYTPAYRLRSAFERLRKSSPRRA